MQNKEKKNKYQIIPPPARSGCKTQHKKGKAVGIIGDNKWKTVFKDMLKESD